MDPEWNHEPGQDDATMLGLREGIIEEKESDHET